MRRNMAGTVDVGYVLLWASLILGIVVLLTVK